MLRAAVHDELLDRSPMSAGKRGQQQLRVVDPAEPLTQDQVHAWSAAPTCLAAVPTFAATTGLRQGELLGLRMGNVDFLRRQVHVREQLRTPKEPGLPTWGPPKTAAGVRTVPLPEVAADALALHLEGQSPVDGEPLFRTQTGRRWRANGLQAAVAKRRKAAGPPDWATFNSTRDVYASDLIRQGVDVRTVMTLLGHTSSEMTLTVKARLWEGAEDNARARLDELWSTPKGHGRATGNGAAR